jgi:hypothetical protein
VDAYDLWAQAVAAEDDKDLEELTASCHTAIERFQQRQRSSRGVAIKTRRHDVVAKGRCRRCL